MKNLRIAKVTLDGYYNYGNILQNYALQKVLINYAEVVDTLWWSESNYLPIVWWKWNWKNLVKYILNYNSYRTKFKSSIIGYEMARQTKNKDFVDRYINYKFIGNRIYDLEKKYDYFLTGSDQVWNPWYAGNDVLFLKFAPKEKRISYAASIASDEIPNNRIDEFKNNLNEMKCISVREQSGADIIYKLTGRKVVVNVDPTLLLPASEWRTMSRKPSWYKGGEYILTYFLGKRPNEIINKISTEYNLPVVNLMDESKSEHYITGVDEFLWAIEHAELVYTDSFHGTVFSIIFRTPFVVCNRVDGAVEGKMSSRIDTLLGGFGLEERRGTVGNGYLIENPLTTPDWSKVEDVLAHERTRTDDYLRQAFGLDEME